MTRKRSNNQWSSSPRPKKFQVQISARKVLASIFLGSRRHPPHWLSSKGRNYQSRVLLISAGEMKGILKEKRHWRPPRGSCSWMTMPWLTRHLQPRRNWPTWDSIVLITHPILRIWPHQTTTCSLDWKKNWKVAIFCLTQRSLLPRRPGWMDKFLNFFEWLAKVRATR